MEYTVEEVLKFQLRDEQGYLLNHSGTDKPYYAYELAEIYHQRKDAENIRKSTKSAPKPFIPGHRKKLFTDKDVEEIKNLKYKQGLSNRRIAKILGCSEKTIRNYLCGKTEI